MSSQSFSPIQREAIWNAYSRRCFYGKEPLAIKDVEVDHVVPEELLNDSLRKAAVFKDYGLSSAFDIRGYGNLVPTCSECNGLKRNNLIPADKMVLYLMRTQVNAERIEKEVAVKEKGQALGPLLRSIQHSLDKGLFSSSEFESALRAANIIELQVNYQDEATRPLPLIEVQIAPLAVKSALRSPNGMDDLVAALRGGSVGGRVLRLGTLKLYVVRLRNGMSLAFSQEENVVTIHALIRPGDTAEGLKSLAREG